MARFSGRAAFGALSARTNGEILVSNRTLSIHQSVDESIISRECILEKRISSLIGIFLRTKLLSLLVTQIKLFFFDSLRKTCFTAFLLSNKLIKQKDTYIYIASQHSKYLTVLAITNLSHTNTYIYIFYP